MTKQHLSPEFVVIKQDQANAKFYAASYVNVPEPTTPESPAPDNQASDYENGSDIGDGLDW